MLSSKSFFMLHVGCIRGFMHLKVVFLVDWESVFNKINKKKISIFKLTNFYPFDTLLFIYSLSSQTFHFRMIVWKQPLLSELFWRYPRKSFVIYADEFPAVVTVVLICISNALIWWSFLSCFVSLILKQCMVRSMDLEPMISQLVEFLKWSQGSALDSYIDVPSLWVKPIWVLLSFVHLLKTWLPSIMGIPITL